MSFLRRQESRPAALAALLPPPFMVSLTRKDWIPAFAGMTCPRLIFRQIRRQIPPSPTPSFPRKRESKMTAVKAKVKHHANFHLVPKFISARDKLIIYYYYEYVGILGTI